MKTTGFKIYDEFGSDITLIVDVIVENGVIRVIDEFELDITKIVDIVRI